MTIRFSRHARRRMQLYKISETVVTDMIGASGSKPGNNTIVRERSGFKYPIKIIFVMEDDILTVVTVYPFKKGNQK